MFNHILTRADTAINAPRQGSREREQTSFLFKGGIVITHVLLSLARALPRGGWRVVQLAAQFDPLLQGIPVKVKDVPYDIFVDLRDRSNATYYLKGDGTGSKKIRKILPYILREGDTFFDVGTHLGLVSAIARHRVGLTGSVIAFEPNPRTARLCEQTFAPFDNVSICQIALSDRNGSLDFYPLNKSDESSLVPIEGVTPISVTVRTLKDVVAEQGVPTVLKIDVEGGEEQILRGAADAFYGDGCPIIFFEALDDHSLQTNTSVIRNIDQSKGGFFHITGGVTIQPLSERRVSSDFIYVPARYMPRVTDIIEAV